VDILELRTDSKDGAELTIMRPDTNEPLLGSDGKPIVFRVASTTSQYAIDRQNELIELRRKRKKITAEMLREDDAETLAKLTLGWSDNFTFGGEKMECSIVNAKKLYLVPGLTFITRQVDAFVTNDANFIQPSQTT
jgi:hypothetical protein